MKIFLTKTISKNLLISGFILYIISYLLKLDEFQIKICSIFIVVYQIIYFFKEYKDFKDYLDVKNYVDKITKRDKPKGKLKEMINTNTMMLERYKLLLDLLKSFSPIPILVLVLSVIRQINFNNGVIKRLLQISLENKIIYTALLIFLIWYAGKIFFTWDKYKLIQFRNLQFQNAYDNIKEKE